jgi:hypothetical protein
MMERYAVRSLMVSTALLSACAAKTPLPPHPEVTAAIRKMETVAVLPPFVEYTRMVFSGENERAPNVEQAIAATLADAAQSAVGARQFTVRKAPEDQTPEHKREMEFELQQLDTALVAAFRQATQGNSENQTTRPRVSIGVAGNPLAHRMNADGLLVTRYSGFQKSTGQQTKEAISGIAIGALTGVVRVPASEGGTVTLMLIDGATGEVLWMGRGSHAVFPRHTGARTAAGTPAAAASNALATFPTREGAPAAGEKPPATSVSQ